MSIITIIVNLANLYSMVIFVYVLLSWFPTKSGFLAELDSILGKICDPYLNIFKRFIPPIGGMVDITPIIALFVLQFVVRLVVGIF